VKIIRFWWNCVHSSRFWNRWTPRDPKWKGCIGHTPSSTERISCDYHLSYSDRSMFSTAACGAQIYVSVSETRTQFNKWSSMVENKFNVAWYDFILTRHGLCTVSAVPVDTNNNETRCSPSVSFWLHVETSCRIVSYRIVFCLRSSSVAYGLRTAGPISTRAVEYISHW